jgi:hypothetical protein
MVWALIFPAAPHVKKRGMLQKIGRQTAAPAPRGTISRVAAAPAGHAAYHVLRTARARCRTDNVRCCAKKSEDVIKKSMGLVHGAYRYQHARRLARASTFMLMLLPLHTPQNKILMDSVLCGIKYIRWRYSWT